MTAEEFYAFARHRHYELVAGRLQVSEPPGGIHGRVAARLAYVLMSHVEAHGLGTVLVESGYVVRRSPDTVRGPDVSFISKARLDPDCIPGAFIPAAPDLVVEIRSPDDSPSKIEEKIADYLAGGTRMIWIVDPARRQVSVRRPDGTVGVIEADGWLEGGEVLPGFRCAVADLMPAG